MTTLIELLTVSLATGFGTAIGNYLATRGLIRHLEKAITNSKKERSKPSGQVIGDKDEKEDNMW